MESVRAIGVNMNHHTTSFPMFPVGDFVGSQLAGAFTTAASAKATDTL